MFRNDRKKLKKIKEGDFDEIWASRKSRVRWLDGSSCLGRIPSYLTFARRPYFNVAYLDNSKQQL